MGTHPIFESDVDCLTDRNGSLSLVSYIVTDCPYHIKMVKGDRQAWKQAYFEKANGLLAKYERIFICDADNVSSKQFQASTSSTCATLAPSLTHASWTSPRRTFASASAPVLPMSPPSRRTSATRPSPPCPTRSPTVSRTSWPSQPSRTSSSPRSSSSRRSWPIHLPLPQPHQLRKQLPRRPPPRPQPSRPRNLTMTWASTCSVKNPICSVYLFCSLFEQIKQAR